MFFAQNNGHYGIWAVVVVLSIASILLIFLEDSESDKI